ncbi:MAG: hypothetical protein ABH862_06080 [Candidatus Omnitrophota bacterium]
MTKVFCRIFLLFFLITNVIGITGCAQLRDKFVRKKEEKIENKRYLSVKEHDIHPSMELYTKRYLFWKTWHKELLEVLPKGNHKKIVVAVEQEVSNLMDMRNMLVDEKAEELQKYLDELINTETVIKKEGITKGNEVRIRRSLKNLGNRIKEEFTFRKMNGCIRDDFRREKQTPS